MIFRPIYVKSGIEIKSVNLVGRSESVVSLKSTNFDKEVIIIQ